MFVSTYFNFFLNFIVKLVTAEHNRKQTLQHFDLFFTILFFFLFHAMRSKKHFILPRVYNIYQFFLKDCPRWSLWSDFSTCSESCGQGFQSRTRSCVNTPVQGDTSYCGEGATMETVPCAIKVRDILQVSSNIWIKLFLSCVKLTFN